MSRLFPLQDFAKGTSVLRFPSPLFRAIERYISVRTRYCTAREREVRLETTRGRGSSESLTGG